MRFVDHCGCLLLVAHLRQNAVDTVKGEFNIDNDASVQLSTSDLTEWGVMDIRPSAWAAIRPIIARIDVIVMEGKRRDDRALGALTFATLSRVLEHCEYI